MKRGPVPTIFVIALLVLLVPALAHQPFFEDKEFTSDKPAQIRVELIETGDILTVDGYQGIVTIEKRYLQKN